MIMMMMILMTKTENVHNLTNFQSTTSRFCMVTDINDTYRIMMMTILMKTQNSNNSANFQVTPSIFFMLMDLNYIYRMMMMIWKIMIIIMRMVKLKKIILERLYHHNELYSKGRHSGTDLWTKHMKMNPI